MNRKHHLLKPIAPLLCSVFALLLAIQSQAQNYRPFSPSNTYEFLSQPYTRDTNFQLQTQFTNGNGTQIKKLVEYPDGKFIIFGDFWSTYSPYAGVCRFFANGLPDESLQIPGYLNADQVQRFDERPYGFMMTHNWNNYTKLSYNGQDIDPEFRNTLHNEVFGNFQGYPYYLPNDRYLVGCGDCRYPANSSNPTFRLARLFSTGHLDTTFKHNIYPPLSSAAFFTKYSDTLLFVEGQYEYYDSVYTPSICRVDTTGALDTTFHSIFKGRIKVLYVQPDGKTIISGKFKLENSEAERGLVRINIDGSLDSTFNNFNNILQEAGISTICPTSDGGYLIGGTFDQYQGYARGNIARIDYNGFLDTTTFTGSGIDECIRPDFPIYVSNIVRGSNDYYYVTGNFKGYNGELTQPVIRFKGPNTLGNDEELARPSFYVYPNPAKAFITVSATTNEFANSNIQIFDLIGRQILQLPYLGNVQTVNTSALAPGIYNLTISNKNKRLFQHKLFIY